MTTTIEVFDSMLGVTMTGVCITGECEERDVMLFSSGTRSWKFFHRRDCCEHVVIEDVCGDLDDLVGSPILQAEQVHGEPPETHDRLGYESETWTFYKFATAKGSVTVRWLGTSNGYYSESVDMEES